MKRAPMDPRPSLTVHTVPDKRIAFSSSFLRELPLARAVLREVAPETLLCREADTEFDRWPPGARLGKLAAMTLAVCITIMAVVFSVQLLVGGR